MSEKSVSVLPEISGDIEPSLIADSQPPAKRIKVENSIEIVDSSIPSTSNEPERKRKNAKLKNNQLSTSPSDGDLLPKRRCATKVSNNFLIFRIKCEIYVFRCLL